MAHISNEILKTRNCTKHVQRIVDEESRRVSLLNIGLWEKREIIYFRIRSKKEGNKNKKVMAKGGHAIPLSHWLLTAEPRVHVRFVMGEVALEQFLL
jgi:hypothetical protein